MSTKFLSPGWRMPRNANQSKSSNYSLDFNGDFINIGNENYVTISSFNISISAWINIDTTSGDRTILASGQSSSGAFDYRLNVDTNNNVYFSARTTSGSPYYTTITGGTTLSTNTWYHICITWDMANFNLYLNGVSDATAVSATTYYNDSGVKRIAIGYQLSSDAGGYRPFYGKIDGVAIFDYPLSLSQVTTLWGGGTSVSNPMALPSPPIAYYPLGTSAWNGQYLTENNAIGDYVFDFVGTSSQEISLTTSNLPSANSSFSMSVWLNRDSTVPSYAGVLSFGDLGSTNVLSMAYINFDTSNNIKYGFYNGDAGNTAISANNWHHVVLTYNGTNATFYINGQVVGIPTQPGTLAIPTTSTLKIGGLNTSAQTFNGKISNAQIFNAVLSGPEIETLYNYGSPIRTLANIPQSSNLKAWYKLDASEVYNSSSTEWSIDNNQNPSAYPSSLNFDGSIINPSVTLTGLGISNEFSVSLWANVDTITSYRGPLGATSNSNWVDGFGIYINANKWNFFVDNWSASKVTSDTTITINTWFHLVGTFSSSGTGKFYINGTKEGTDFTGVTLDGLSNNFGIGNVYNGGGLFDGKLSNVQIWNKELIGSEVETLYNNGSPYVGAQPQNSNLKGWWKLNNTTTGVEDSAGSNNGTNNGATEYPGFVNTLAGDSSGMSQANLVQSDLQTVAPYSKYAMNFIGTDNDYIDCGNSALTAISGGSTTLTTTMTISTWFKLGSSSASKGLVGFGDLNNNYGGLAIRHESGVFSFLRSNQHMVSGGYSFSDTTNWHNMVFVYDPNSASNCKVYIDSVNVNLSFVNVGDVSLENKKLTIGAYYGLSDTFTGELSNFSTWNAALTSAQVSEIYNEGLPSNLNSHSAYSNLVSWWQLGENSSFDGNDWIVADEKGSNNGDGQNMTEANLTNGVGTTANGVSSGMSEGNLVGDAPYSTANALSTNMVVTSRVTGSGNTP